MTQAFFKSLPPLPSTAPVLSGPEWKQASPAWIDRALATALAKPSGGWYVVCAARALKRDPARYSIAGRDLVVWRSGGAIQIAPDACPHMGASLSEGCVRDGRLVCPWHGLELGDKPHGRWRPLPVYDDGVLVWVRLAEAGAGRDDDVPSVAPFLPERPAQFLDAVMVKHAMCEPEDVLANRLDPWHGVHYHPYAFSKLRVIDQQEDEITVRVAYRVWRSIAVDVDARFHTPDPRTIAMTIVAGDGEGTVIETHATPVSAGRTAVIEATLATSDRPGFRIALRAARLLRPLIRRAADRLWVDDAAYAERRYALRTNKSADFNPLTVL